MNPYDPTEFLIRFFAATHELFQRHPAFAERVALQKQLYRELAVTEPTTLRARLAELHSASDSPPDFAEDLVQCLAAVSQDAPGDFRYYPPAQDLHTYFQRAVAASSNDVVYRHLDVALAFDLKVLRASLIEGTRPDAQISFERKVRILVEVIRNAAEQWYRPILRCALAVSYEIERKTKATVPNELGAVMGAIRDSQAVPTSIVDDQVRIIRNAVAHSQVKLDIEKESISFENRQRAGTVEVLGPLNWEDLVELAWNYIFAWSTLALVCRKMHRLTSGAEG
jgi:hypothetical protein